MSFQPLPAETVLSGLFWSWVVPTALFIVAFIATFLLYRRFARDPDHTP